MNLSNEDFPWKALIIIAILILISPIFGIILSDKLGFHEPLDVVAEELNLPDWTEDLNWTPFLGYFLPNLLPEAGYILAGFLGIGIILIMGFVLQRLLK